MGFKGKNWGVVPMKEKVVKALSETAGFSLGSLVNITFLIPDNFASSQPNTSSPSWP
jgi:hypothetical protein